MYVLVVSDLHLGKGRFHKNGHVNIMEEFEEDERFKEFLDYYSENEYKEEKVELILNGDILNLIQIDFEGIYTTLIDDEVTVNAIEEIYKGHSLFFEALRKFANSPKKIITYVIGNHDNGMAFHGAQKKFNELVGATVQFAHSYTVKGIHIEHGHRFEAINNVPMKKFFIKGPKGQDILNLPWGTLYCISILPLFKKDRPNIDKVRPLQVYIRWCIFNDFWFFLKVTSMSFIFFMKTYLSYLFGGINKANISIKILKDITIYPNYERQAKRIIRRFKDVQVVVMGHTHIPEFRTFGEGKSYFNTGTWNPVFSLDTGKHKNSQTLSYVLIKIDDEDNHIIFSRLNQWQGHWRPFLQMAEN